MSTLSFKAYCIENYAEYKNASSSMIFNKFEKSGLLAHLEDDSMGLYGQSALYLYGLIENDWENPSC